MPPTVVDLTLAKSPSPAPPSAPVLTTAKIVIPKLPRVDAVLLKELATTPEDRLRRLVLSICQANSEAALMAEEALLVPESEVNYQAAEESTEDEWSEEEEEEEEEEDEEDKEGKGETEKEEGLDGKKTSKENNASGVSQSTNTLKRYRGRFAICESCEEEYDVSDNHKGDCYYHDGILEPDGDGDFWGELDRHDRKFGIFGEEMQKEHPERYKWDCCNELGYDMGCKSDRRHVERIDSAKRTRY